MSGVTPTSSALPLTIADAGFPARSLTGVSDCGVYSRVTFWVPSAIGWARLRVVTMPATATVLTAGPFVSPIRIWNPPALVGTEASSRASDQVTVTVGPAAAALSALGRTPSTVRAVSASTASCPSCTVRLPACVSMALPPGVLSASAAIAIPSRSSSPSATVYSNRRTVVPEPDS